MTKLTQCLGLDLPDPLTCDIEFLADFFQRSGAAVFQTETKDQNLLFPIGQGP